MLKNLLKMENRDIMVHGIPNIEDAGTILREELDRFLDEFGPIQWVRMGQNRGFHRTNYAFVRYEDQTVHNRVVDHFNNVGIPGARTIWFELNRRPTDEHHLLQHIPATPRVAIQLAEIDRIRNDLDQQRARLEVQREEMLQQQTIQQQQLRQLTQQVREVGQDLAQARITGLEQQRRVRELETLNNEHRDLITALANNQPIRRRTRRGRANEIYFYNELEWEVEPEIPPPTPEFMPIEQMSPVPTTKVHRFTGASCPICLEAFEACNSVVILQCGHLSCEACMHRYVTDGARVCPVCRSKLGFNFYTRPIYNE